MLFCLFSCKKENEKSIEQIYAEALALTRELPYQKFSLSRSVTFGAENTSYTEPYSMFCKMIKKDGAISYYSERNLKIETEAGTATPILQHHYKDGVLYQTLEKSKLKHTLSAQDFEKQYLGFDNIILSLPEGVSGTNLGDNAEGGSDYAISLDVSRLEKSERDKLYTVFEACSSHSLDVGYIISGSMDVNFSTDFDGYFVKYSLSFNISGSEGNEQKSLKMTLALDIFNPGSHFVMNELTNTSSYTEGTLNIK